MPAPTSLAITVRGVRRTIAQWRGDAGPVAVAARLQGLLQRVEMEDQGVSLDSGPRRGGHHPRHAMDQLHGP